MKYPKKKKDFIDCGFDENYAEARCCINNSEYEKAYKIILENEINHMNALHSLGLILSVMPELGDGKMTSIECFRQAANKGHVLSMWELVLICICDGEGHIQGKGEIIDKYSKEIILESDRIKEGSDADENYAVGMLYKMGWSEDHLPDIEKAIPFFSQAASLEVRLTLIYPNPS